MSFPTTQPIVGTNAVVQVGVPGAGGAVTSNWITIKNSDYTINPKNGVGEAPNTTDGIVRAPGLNDYDFSFKGSTDASGANATNAVETNIMPGTILDFKAFRNGTGATPSGPFWQGRIIVADLKVTTGTATVENWELTSSKQSGPLIKPDGTSW